MYVVIGNNGYILTGSYGVWLSGEKVVTGKCVGLQESVA